MQTAWVAVLLLAAAAAAACFGGVGCSRVNVVGGVAVVQSSATLHGALVRVSRGSNFSEISVEGEVYIAPTAFMPQPRLEERSVVISGSAGGVLRLGSRSSGPILHLSSNTQLTWRNITLAFDKMVWRTVEDVLGSWIDVRVSSKVVYDKVTIQIPRVAWFAVRREWQDRFGTDTESDSFKLVDFRTEKVIVKEALLMILDPSQTGDAPIRVRNGWEYVDALKEAETPAQFPLNIIIEDDIILLEEHLGNKGPLAINRDVVVESISSRILYVEVEASLSNGRLAEVYPGVQFTHKHVAKVQADYKQDICGQVCLPTYHSAISYSGSGFACGLSHVDSVLLVSCPYVNSLASAVNSELRTPISPELPPPLMRAVLSGDDAVLFDQFVGYGVCFSNVSVSCGKLGEKPRDDGEKKAIIVMVASFATAFLLIVLAIWLVPKCWLKYVIKKDRKHRQAGVDSMSTSLGGLNTKGSSVKTYLMGQINGERLGISDDAVEITEQIASGGYGVVYKGTWKSLPVAIKTVIFQDVADGAGKEKQRAIFEAAISSSIAHRNVVQTYTYSFKQLQTSNALNSVPIHGDDFSRVCVDWKLYIVQELCEGGSLRNSLKDRVLKSCNTHDKFVRGVLQLALDIAEGLLHLHNHNIIHGDVNTKNVLLREDTSGFPLNLVAKIADFGLSVKMNYMQSHISNHKAGTPFYMAPEVVQHGVLSKRADIFSYGVVLWEIYHQSCPIQTAGGNGNLQYHEKFPKFPVSCPMLYALLCVVCLSPSPEDRPDFEFVIRVLKAIRSSIDNDKEFLPSKIQKQNLDLVKKLNGKTGRELVEFVGELLGEEPSPVESGSNVASQDVVHDSAEMGGDAPGSAKGVDSARSKRKMKVVSTGTDPTYSMTITLGSRDGHSGYSSDSISFSWDRASSPEPKGRSWGSKQKALAAQKATAQRMRNYQEVPVVGANPLLGSMEYGAPPEDNSVLPEIHESTKPALPESAQPSPTFPLRLSAPAAGQREMELVTSGSSQRSDYSPTGYRQNVRGVGLISAQGGTGRWSQEHNVRGDAPQLPNVIVDESGSVDYFSLTHPNSEYYTVSVDEHGKSSGINSSDRHYYGPS